MLPKGAARKSKGAKSRELRPSAAASGLFPFAEVVVEQVVQSLEVFDGLARRLRHAERERQKQRELNEPWY